MTWVDDEKIAVDHTRKAQDVTIWDLVIDKVGPEHAGIYECQVSSSLGHNKRVKLNVIGKFIYNDNNAMSYINHLLLVIFKKYFLLLILNVTLNVLSQQFKWYSQ